MRPFEASQFATVRDTIRGLLDQVEDLLPTQLQQRLGLFLGILLILLGFVLGPFELSLMTQILILGIFGMAYDLLFGYTGLLSFGHAAFFGLGSYTAVYGANELELSLLPILGLVLVLGAVLAISMGVIALRTTGVYFAMITLAMAQLLYLLTLRTGDVLGGASGLPLNTRPGTILPIDLTADIQFYILTVMLLVVIYYALKRVLHSPVGDVFRAIRENEQRAEMIGYNVFYYKLAALTVSGVISALAGLLWGQFLYFSSPNFLFWTMTGDVLLLTLFGGVGTLTGPIVGAGFVVLIEEFLSPITDQWRLFMGAVFVAVVLFLPEGILGTFSENE